MNIIAYRKIYLAVSLILIVVSIASVLMYGLKLGIDFTGGTLWQIKFSDQISASEVKDFFAQDLKENNVMVYPGDSPQNFLIRFGHISELNHQNYLQGIKTKFGQAEELNYETIGPSVGAELRTKAVWAVALVLLGISLYVAYAFRKVSYPIKSWKYGSITLITLLHDVIIPTGLLAILGHIKGIELDTNFIVALLVIMGFSVHDTIVVFDRIRENLLLYRAKMDLTTIINTSINQTIARSINTSLTLVLVLLALFFFGPATLKYFILVILVGVIIGTYSSIFIASPSLLFIKDKKE